MADDRNDATGFETDIKPLFREIDRQSMLRHFDLWSYDDVSRYADAILARLRDGTMPCDGAWPKRRSTSSNDGRRMPSRNDR